MKIAKLCLFAVISSLYMLSSVFYIGAFLIDLRYNSWNANSYGALAMEVISILGLLGSFAFANQKYQFFKIFFYILFPLTIPYYILETMEKKKNYPVTREQINLTIWVMGIINLAIHILWFFGFIVTIFIFKLLRENAKTNVDLTFLILIQITYSIVFCLSFTLSVILFTKIMYKNRIPKGVLIAYSLIPVPLNSFLLFFDIAVKNENARELKKKH
ncbi:hypothetical protein [Mesoplasma seiffertii]|uniref:hypothetical protein n=1 Tax=Mesoplasma seiffertii TaxID=28224 RepID=UPI00047B9E89|nr:hypothetical protein [Mesoplasma seiffertii]